MPPKEPTRHQLSSRLTYSGQTPSFLLKLQNKIAGRGADEDEDDPQFVDGLDEFGRERRPAIPERFEDDNGGSDNEDDLDEKPVVVVLKEGKHLTAREAENERRKVEGLPALPKEPELGDITTPSAVASDSSSKALEPPTGLSFSSKKTKESKATGSKRKLMDVTDKSQDNKQSPKKKPKALKTKQGPLSFDRDDIG